MKKEYMYGMRMRGFASGCQPMKGLLEWKDCEGEYYSFLWYDRKLSDAEMKAYDLDYLDYLGE